VQFQPEVTPEIVAARSERYRPDHPQIDYERLARRRGRAERPLPLGPFALFDRRRERSAIP
jgi:hypothetical protein